MDNPGSGGSGAPDAKAREVWEAALAALRARVSRQSFGHLVPRLREGPAAPGRGQGRPPPGRGALARDRVVALRGQDRTVRGARRAGLLTHELLPGPRTPRSAPRCRLRGRGQVRHRMARRARG